MRRFTLTIGLLLIVSFSVYAQFGVFQPAERKLVKDPATGIKLMVLTDIEKNDSFIYQTDPMWTPDQRYLLFRSSSRASDASQEKRQTQFFLIEVATGKIIQVTDGKVGSVFMANTDNTLFVNRREGSDWTLYRMDLERLLADAAKSNARPFDAYLTKLGTFPNTIEMGQPGGWCISSDDRYAYITVTREGTEEERARMEAQFMTPRDDQPIKIKPSLCGIRQMDLHTGETTIICNTEFKVGHIQASRFKPNEIVFCCETGGDAPQRMWFCDALTKEYRPLYEETPLDWVTHETFGTEDYVYFNILGWQDRLRKQAHGIFRINLRNNDVDCFGNVETDENRGVALSGRGFWHCNSSRDNKWIAGDTFAGSIWIIHVATGHRYQIASDIKMKPNHGHPFFSPDGSKLCFQSGHYSDGKRLNLVMVDLNTIPFLRKLR